MRAQAPTEKAIFDQKGQWFFVTLRGGSEPVWHLSHFFCFFLEGFPKRILENLRKSYRILENQDFISMIDRQKTSRAASWQLKSSKLNWKDSRFFTSVFPEPHKPDLFSFQVETFSWIKVKSKEIILTWTDHSSKATRKYLEKKGKYFSFYLKCDDFVILAPLFLDCIKFKFCIILVKLYVIFTLSRTECSYCPVHWTAHWSVLDDNGGTCTYPCRIWNQIGKKVQSFVNPHGFLAVCLHDLQVAPANVDWIKAIKITRMRIVFMIVSVNLSVPVIEQCECKQGFHWTDYQGLKMEAPASVPGTPWWEQEGKFETQFHCTVGNNLRNTNQLWNSFF